MVSPNEFLKTRRPERFSDSKRREVTDVDRPLLEYHLDSITSRSQENDFARFAHRLCELEICPNLLPQTGPTGGGDSKVDTETYPVSDDLALLWYVGEGRDAATERWGFAFSAKKKWRPKVASDIKKLVETKRGYSKAFFVTNQAVSDRERAEVEDKLRKEHRIDVRILDRTWMVQRVFANRREKLAVEELRLTTFARTEEVRGPLDARRIERLDAINGRLEEAVDAGNLDGTLVDEGLEYAEVARSLEKPKAELALLFGRAIDLATKYGSQRQRVEATYQWAWTLFWWFEDYEAFAKQYAVVEAEARDSRNVYDLERLSNILTCFVTAIRRGLSIDPNTYDQHKQFLEQALREIEGDTERRGAALHAKMLRMQHELIGRLQTQSPFDDILGEFKRIILDSRGLVNFPLEPLVEVLTDIGGAIGSAPAYDDLFSTIVEVVAEREGEVRGARLRLTRGEQLLDKEAYFEAIAELGQAFTPLYKEESREDVVRALYLCGCAYDAVGLTWAARGTLLAGASIATDDLWLYGSVTPYQAAGYRRLKWLELRLGRVPYILTWHELDMIVRQQLKREGYDYDWDGEPDFQIPLAGLFLRADFADLPRLTRLPDELERIGLLMAQDALLFALGHEEALRTAAKKADMGEEFEKFLDGLTRASTSAKVVVPQFGERKTCTLTTRVLGCDVTVECDNDAPCVEVGESILASFEAVLATSALKKAIAREPRLRVRILKADLGSSVCGVTVEEEGGRPVVLVRCRTDSANPWVGDEGEAFASALQEAVWKCVAHVVMFEDVKHDLEALLRDERVMDRAFSIAGRIGFQGNVLGKSPKNDLASWLPSNAKEHALIRREPLPSPVASAPNETLKWKAGKGEPPAELRDVNRRSHERMRTISLIREPLWDRAKWGGTYFECPPPGEAPLLALIFLDADAGSGIFRQWREEVGSDDRTERLRISFITGISRKQPNAYRVVISSNPPADLGKDEIFAIVTRNLNVDARTPVNLRTFLDRYRQAGEFYFAPAFGDGASLPRLDGALAIKIHRAHVFEAWKLGENDLEGAAIRNGDDIIVPDGETEPPYLRILERRRKE